MALGPRDSRELRFTLSPEQMSFVTATGERAVLPGTYSVYVGSAQPRPGAERGAAFRIEGTQILSAPPLAEKPGSDSGEHHERPNSTTPARIKLPLLKTRYPFRHSCPRS